MNEYQTIAAGLLSSGTAAMVIGYSEGSAKRVRPVFFTRPEEASTLVFDSRCVQNIAVYLTKKEIRTEGKIAIIASLPVMRSIIQLASEHQLSEEKIIVIGITPSGEVKQFNGFDALDAYVSSTTIEIEARYREKIEQVEKMTLTERWNFWKNELSACFKCYACRAACPMCYCTRCTVEMNQPQWIPVPSHTLGNFEWHIIRAMHLAGRCVDCNACAEACPLGIPFNLLTKQMILQFKKDFGGYNPSLKGLNILSSYLPDDKENFIQ